MDEQRSNFDKQIAALTVERDQARAALREIDRICAVPGISSSNPRVMIIADIARAALSSTNRLNPKATT